MAEATLAVSFCAVDEPMHVDRVDAQLLANDHVAIQAAESSVPQPVVSCGKPFPGHELAVMDGSKTAGAAERGENCEGFSSCFQKCEGSRT